ncbi:hypothetical protein BD410DRAFT_563645 [Rickenella mellea]|uniref:HMG box domain-containing protein n=1 Tax=Rickenella mellea TaxID=50990 RepID=A0A4Y7QFL9_9AGAM|nr:hypothetical protein BD410DRAFT_563645 [Rickenella mellea]
MTWMMKMEHEPTKLDTHTDPHRLKMVLVPKFNLHCLPLPPPNHKLVFVPAFTFFNRYPPIVPLFSKRTPARQIRPMPGPVRTQGGKPAQPPRPPNAWILYRSDKLREIPSLNPGAPRLPQADISKQISAMWKNECEEVRAKYEYLANIKKTEHQAQYPNYRFQPMKRADKERIREEKKAEKERERSESKKGKPGSTFSPGVPLVGPSMPFATEARYGPAGPSPPLSACPSPIHISPESNGDAFKLEKSLPSPEHASPHASVASESPQSRRNRPAETPAATSSRSYSPNPSRDDSPGNESESHAVPHIFAPRPTTLIRPPSASAWQTPELYPSSETDGRTSTWSDAPTPSRSNSMQLNPYEDYFQFTLPDGWNQGEPPGDLFFPSDESMQAMLSGTLDPNIYQLDLSQNSLFQGPPPGEIEISMPNVFAQYQDSQSQPNEYEDFSNLLVGFNPEEFSFGVNESDSSGKSTFANTSDILSMSIDKLFLLQQQSHTRNTSTSSTNVPAFNPALTLPSPPTTASASSTDTPPYGSASLIAPGNPTHDFVDNPNSMLHTPQPSPPRYEPPQQTHAMQSTYVPPSGASNASMRRAAASWKSSFPAALAAIDDDEPPQHDTTRRPSWGVPAGAS